MNKLILLILLLSSFVTVSPQGLILHKQTGKDTVIINTVDSLTLTQSLIIHKNTGMKDSVQLSAIDSVTFDKSINPFPVVTAINPTSVISGSPDFTLKVQGTNFKPVSVIQLNGTALSTTFNSAAELQALVPASAVAGSGVINITVFTPTPGGGTSVSVKLTVAQITITKEDFETGAKGSYAAADATLATGVWTLTDALIGNSTSDAKNGNQSVRMRNSGKLTMKFNLASGAGTVSIQHAMYGADASGKWQLWYSTDDGTTWAQKDSAITTSSKTLQAAAFTFDIEGIIRFEIRKIDNSSNRINFDDITITSYGSSTGDPVPVLTSVSPASDTVGAGDLILTATGNSFLPTSVVTWNGSNLATVFISSTQLQATVPAASFAAAGTAKAAVFTPTGGTSSVQLFNINFGLNSPVPVIKSLSPAVCEFGRSSFTMTVSGSNFVSASVVKWNDVPLVTNYISPTELRAEVTADLVDSIGSANVSVYTAPPSGGISGVIVFKIYEKIVVSGNINLTMGNPSGAVSDTNYPTNYLIQRGQLCTSYNRDRGIPNWVSWEVDSSWLGSASRGSFKTDQLVPAQWYRVSTGDYSSTGFNRGHMCPSADRTRTEADNDSVFFMTNIIPQSGPQNGGPWGSLETYCRDLALQGNKLYIVAGAYGEGGTGTSGYMTSFANGKVTVPAKTWKVVMVLPPGENDVSRVTTTTRCIAIIMPNDQGPFAAWQSYRVSVDAVEALTGYDFFSNVPTDIQAAIESVVDNQ